MNDDSDYLLLSGIQHFSFCRRQWALIHIEQQWAENELTQEGHWLHRRVHDADFTERRGAVLLSRGMPIRSETLKITGQCDMVEITEDLAGVPIHGREGRWRLYPVEYKHGKANPESADAMQLCAQAMCLEEMFVTDIPEGALYSGEQHRRHPVVFTDETRQSVRDAVKEMHQLFDRGFTPKARAKAACKRCSLREICQPELPKGGSARAYVTRMLEGETIE